MKTGIESVSVAEIGIRAKIIQPKCLRCHLSSLQESERDGAPVGVNLETLELVKQNGDKIIRNTITIGNMSPSRNFSIE